jgi:hypothetical protein
MGRCCTYVVTNGSVVVGFPKLRLTSVEADAERLARARRVELRACQLMPNSSRNVTTSWIVGEVLAAGSPSLVLQCPRLRLLLSCWLPGMSHSGGRERGSFAFSTRVAEAETHAPLTTIRMFYSHLRNFATGHLVVTSHNTASFPMQRCVDSVEPRGLGIPQFARS